jgi:hypothetical protein
MTQKLPISTTIPLLSTGECINRAQYGATATNNRTFLRGRDLYVTVSIARFKKCREERNLLRKFKLEHYGPAKGIALLVTRLDIRYPECCNVYNEAGIVMLKQTNKQMEKIM